MSVALFTFAGADEAQWAVVNDGVMGGRSTGHATVQNGVLRFTGTIITDGGGFTSIRARCVVDLTDCAGLELRVRGSGREFEVELDDGLRNRGRRVSRRAAFPSTKEWNVIRVPFSALGSTVYGQAVNAPQVDLRNVCGVGFYMADGLDGDFWLEVAYVRAYGEDRT